MRHVPSYMIEARETKRYDDAIKLAVENVVGLDPSETQERASVGFKDDEFRLNCFEFEVAVSSRDGNVRFVETTMKPILPLQLVILHYLAGSSGEKPKGDVVPFRNLEGGLAYDGIFKARSTMQLSSYIDREKHSLEEISKALEYFGASPVEIPGDISVRVMALPLVPIYLTLWLGDEELSSNADIYFDESLPSHLPTEDAVVLGENFARFLREELKASRQ